MVKSSLPKEKTITGGKSTRIVGTTLAKVGTAKQVIGHLSGVYLKKDGCIEVAGKGTPIIYVNDKLLRDPQELERLKSEDVQKIEVLTSPGAKYDANTSSVIRIFTLKNKEDGWTLDVMSKDGYAERTDMSQQINWGYKHNKLETMASIRYDLVHKLSDSSYDITTHVDSLWQQQATTHDYGKNHTLSGNLAFNYNFSLSTSIGAQYDISLQPTAKTHSHNLTEVFANQEYYDSWNTSEDVDSHRQQTHTLNAFLNSTLGKWTFSLNGCFLSSTNKPQSSISEQSERYQDYTAATHERTNNRLWAFKYLMSRNIGMGELSLGAEYTSTRRHTTFSGYAGVLEGTNDKIHDYNLAGFADWQMKLSEHTKWGIGLRYEHVIYDFFEDQIKSDLESKVYNNIFPTLSFSSAIGQVNYGFDYHVRTIRPAYEMLKSAVNYGNRLTYMSGTPSLQPTYIHELGVNAAYKVLNIQMGFNHYKDDIFFNIEQLAGNEKVSVNKFTNHPSRNEMTAAISYAPTFGFWHPMLAANMNYQWLEVEHLGEAKNMDGISAILQWENSFRLPSQWLIRLDGLFMSAGKRQNMSTKSSGAVNMSIYKEWMNGKLSCLLEATDLFHIQKEVFTLYFSKTKEYSSSSSNTCGVSLTLRYSLNGKSTKYKGTGAGEEELRRL